MFVLQSTLRQVQAQLNAATNLLRQRNAKYNELLDEWNTLVNQINEKGGQSFLERGQLSGAQPKQLSAEDIKRLLQLCHPDKHGGSELANTMTQKLLTLR